MIKLLDIIFEGKQVGPLYHFTSLEACLSILKSNTLKASINSHYDASLASSRQNRNATPHVSFTRYKGVDMNDYTGGMDVILTLDGDRLSQNYKITPFSMVDNPKLLARHTSSWKDTGDYENNPRYQYQAEMEERIYRDIPNIRKYIIGITLNKEVWPYLSPLQPEDLKLISQIKEKFPKFEYHLKSINGILAKALTKNPDSILLQYFQKISASKRFNEKQDQSLLAYYTFIRDLNIPEDSKNLADGAVLSIINVDDDRFFNALRLEFGMRSFSSHEIYKKVGPTLLRNLENNMPVGKLRDQIKSSYNPQNFEN